MAPVDPSRTPSAFSPLRPFVERHIGPDDTGAPVMLKELGFAGLDELMQAAVPASIRSAAELDLPAAVSEEEAAALLRDLAGPQPHAGADDRARLPRHHHPGGDPAQHPRGPGLVHRLHALPAGDLPGPARGAAELPDHGRRPDRAADRQRLAARRGHRGRRGDDPGPPRQARRRGTLRRRRRRAAPDHRGRAHPRRGDGHRGRSSATSPTGCPRATSAACSCSTPAPRERCATRARSSSRPTPRAVSPWWPPTCWR